MPKKEAGLLMQRILEDVGQHPWAREAQLSKKALLLLVQECDFKTRLDGLLAQPGVEPAQALSLCLPVMERLCPGQPENWLSDIYALLVRRLYPDDAPPLPQPVLRASVFYLVVLRALLEREEQSSPFAPDTYFAFATPEECGHSPNQKQYETFLSLLKSEFIMELMRIGRAIMPFDMLGHVAGVHHIAMHTARQLIRRGMDVDLPLISAAAAAHDIGKYGCKGEEQRRIPYLHYYYTEQWLNRYGLNHIAHVAANHSTWDLELENLPVESLLLIYADFRVKSLRVNGGREQTRFLTLRDSYDVILSKLDNVDDAKRRRYERVYAKLADFEAYLCVLGVNIDPFSTEMRPPRRMDAALLHGEEAAEGLKFQAISHNLRLMHRISADTSFADLLEAARTETDWQNIRSYIDIFEEYFTYMTQKQKQLTMRFLYELFLHSQGDIRYQAAALYARMLAGYDVTYRKELPRNIRPATPEQTSLSLWAQSLELILLPDHKIAPNHRAWISYTLKVVLPHLLGSVPEKDAAAYLNVYLRCFEEERFFSDMTVFVLLDSLLHVPAPLLDPERYLTPLRLAARLAALPESHMQAAALRLALHVLRFKPHEPALLRAVKAVLAALPREKDAAILFLLYRISALLEDGEAARPAPGLAAVEIGDIFLDNLKTATSWVLKEVNIEFLLYRVGRDGPPHAFQVAAHFANLVRVSERFAVRNRAGEALVEIAPQLTLDQRNEIAVELTRGLESASYEFAKYIPRYLGRFLLYLHPKELDETLDELRRFVKSANSRAACVALETLGVLLEHYGDAYETAFPEPQAAFERRRRVMLSMLLGALAHHDETVMRTAFLVVGKYLFGGALAHEQKRALFALAYKKLLQLIGEQTPGKLTFFSNAASLNHIYRFLIDAQMTGVPIRYANTDKVAFFPGTFDPFSASHLGIVKEIKKLGFEVYLALDEFSWSKHTQPHMVRRRIVNMSVADVFGVYLFPEDIPVNLANPEDLRNLLALFEGKTLYIAAGSDVVRNASAYRKAPQPFSVHGMNHVIFLRSSASVSWQKERELVYSLITGDIKELTLPPALEDISSSSIRESVDHNRDICSQVDPVVQSFIYDFGLYLREPQFKELVRPENLFVRCYEPQAREARERLFKLARQAQEVRGKLEFGAEAERLTRLLQKPDARLIALEQQRESAREVRGVALCYATSAALLFDEFHNIRLAEYARRHTSGKIAVLAGIYADHAGDPRQDSRLLLTETLAECLRQDYTYALYIGANSPHEEELFRALERQGFLRLPELANDAPVYAVDMRSPVTLVEDVYERIKPPLNTDREVVRVLREAHERLSLAMAGLYPGRLMLSFHSGILTNALIQKIMQANGVEGLPQSSRQLGEYMCVPYGKTLRSVLVPNTVTKGLHVEKTYQPDMKKFDILEYPGYATLANQVRTIKSFNRPVLLVDDLLHKGYRMEALDPLFKQAGLNVAKILVGLLSGRGKDLMAVQGREVDCVYFIPNLRYWFVESELYPFLGGDSVRRSSGARQYLLPSVNQIFPYTAPSFISATTNSALFQLSYTCLQNALEILRTLERRHQERMGFNLTLMRLGEALHTPRVPDRGGCMRYDRVLSPSVYVENDIELLLRLESVLRQG